ncbi:hypothetical protein ACFLUT_03960, partial [Chloroflexota bacterium]
ENTLGLDGRYADILDRGVISKVGVVCDRMTQTELSIPETLMSATAIHRAPDLWKPLLRVPPR